MDRANISFASLQMNQALHFSGAIYGFGAGVFFLSYAVCEVPSNLALYRFGARRWLSRIMLTWGLIAICMLFVRTPWQFYTARFFLGMAEAGFFPGVVFYLMQWFPPQLRARAVSRFYVSLPLSGVFMGAIAGALLNLNGRLGLAGWQWLFLVEGIPPILLSVAFFLLLPDNPAQAPWLTEAERNWFANSVDRTGDHIHHPAEPIRRILIDPRVWQIGIFGFLSAHLLLRLRPHPSPTCRDLHPLQRHPYRFCNRRHQPARKSPQLPRCQVFPPLTRESATSMSSPCILMALGLAAAGSFSNAPGIAIPALCCVSISFNAMQGAWLGNHPRRLPPGRSAAAAIAAVNTLCILGGFVGPYFMGLVRTSPATTSAGSPSSAHPHAHRRRHHGLPRPSGPAHNKTGHPSCDDCRCAEVR